MSFLTYITGFFYELWTFADFDRLCKLEKRVWPFEEISNFSNGGHLGYRTALTDTILKGNHLRIISKLEKRVDEIKKKSLKLLCQSQPIFAEMIIGWHLFKIVAGSTVMYPRWPPLLKIEISSNGQTLFSNLYNRSKSVKVQSS
jgi:hypothetical protein